MDQKPPAGGRWSLWYLLLLLPFCRDVLGVELQPRGARVGRHPVFLVVLAAVDSGRCRADLDRIFRNSPIAGRSIPTYAALASLIINFIVVIVLTPRFNAMRAGRGEDETETQHYV